MNTCRYCERDVTDEESVATDSGRACDECAICCDCGKSPATTWSRDPLCGACLTVREEHDDAAAEWAYERDAEDRYYREGRYAR